MFDGFDPDPFNMKINLVLEKDGSFTMSADEAAFENAFDHYIDQLGAHLENLYGQAGLTEALKASMPDPKTATASFNTKGTYTVDDDIITLRSDNGDKSKFRIDGDKLIAINDDGSTYEESGMTLTFTKK